MPCDTKKRARLDWMEGVGDGKEIVERFVFPDTDLTEVLMQAETFGIALLRGGRLW